MAAMDQRVWRRSTRCDSSACVEVELTAVGIHVRDSTCTDGPTLDANRDQWEAFLGLVRNEDIKVS